MTINTDLKFTLFQEKKHNFDARIPGGYSYIWPGRGFRAPKIPKTGSNCPKFDCKSGFLLKNAGKNEGGSCIKIPEQTLGVGGCFLEALQIFSM